MQGCLNRNFKKKNMNLKLGIKHSMCVFMKQLFSQVRKI